MEIRQTFTPSDQMRLALADFLSPAMDKDTKESRMAAFLFRSWRRRLIETDRYSQAQRRAIPEAEAEFAQLHKRPNGVVWLDGEIALDRKLKLARLAVRLKPSGLVAQASEIFERVPNMEFEPPNPTAKRLLYVEFKTAELAPADQLMAASQDLHELIVHPSTAHSYSLTPSHLTTRNTLTPLRSLADHSEAD